MGWRSAWSTTCPQVRNGGCSTCEYSLSPFSTPSTTLKPREPVLGGGLMTAILNRGATGPSQAARLSQGHTDSSSGRSPAEFWHLPESAGTQALLPADLALVLGARAQVPSPHPPALKAPFMGLLHTPLGRPDKTTSVGIIFLFPDGSVCWLHPGPPITAWGLGAQRQVPIRRRQQEKKATQCSASQSSGLFYQGSLGGIFLGHLRGPGSQAGHEEKRIL